MNKKNRNSRKKSDNRNYRNNANRKGNSNPVRESLYQSPDMQVVEGRHAVREALLAGTRRIHEVVISDGVDNAPILEDIQNLAEELRVPLHFLPKTKFKAVTITESAQGVLAKCEPLPSLELEDLIEGSQNPFILVLDGIMDPRNLGAIVLLAEPKLVPPCTTGLLINGSNSFVVKLQYCAEAIDSTFATNKGKN